MLRPLPPHTRPPMLLPGPDASRGKDRGGPRISPGSSASAGRPISGKFHTLLTRDVSPLERQSRRLWSPKWTLADVYIATHFAADDTTVRELLSRRQAADLITVTDQGMLATFLPLVFHPDEGEHGVLRGHVARNNGQWR